MHVEAAKRIIPALINTPPTVADYLAEGLVVVASAEYPKDWDSLTQELVDHMDDQNHDKNLRLWKVIKNITKRYPQEVRSDELYHEINVTIAAIHPKLLYFMQGYLSQLENIKDAHLLHQCLLIYKALLKTFYNINSQDLPAMVEENLSSWAEILKSILAKKIDMQNLTNSETDTLWFECKGEAIKSALMFATKYQEEFMDAIKPFANEIWNICQESNANEKFTNILVHSMKYFKSFCESPNFIGFFEDNVTLMFTKVLIPNLTPNESTTSYFEEEPQAFIENLLSNKEYGERPETVCSFIKSLSRFHNEKVEETLKIVLGEYINSMAQNPSPQNEIVCINLVCFSCILGFRQEIGVVEINMHKELIESTYHQLIKTRLAPIFEAIAKGEVSNPSIRTSTSSTLGSPAPS